MVPTTLRSIEHPLSSLQDHRFLPILKNNILTKERFSDSESSSISDIFEISTRDDHPPFVYSAGNLEVYTSANTSYPMEQTKESEVPIHDIPSVYLNHIANALGFTFQGRRFQFAEENSPGKGNYNTKTRTIKELAKVIHDSGTLPDLQMGIARNKLTSDSQPLLTTRFIQAPGFRNDFYSNLVCWSPITNNIVFGIAGFAYCWDSSSHNIREIILHDYDIITCISCSTKDPMVIGTAAGRLILLSQLDHYHIATEYGTDGGSIHAVTWFKDNKRFIASDNTGDVLLMEIVHHLGTVSLKMVYKFKVHQQLVCGMLYIQTKVNKNKEKHSIILTQW